MVVDMDDKVEYEVVTMEGESIYFKDAEEAKECFCDRENNALVLNKVAIEQMEVYCGEESDGNS